MGQGQGHSSQQDQSKQAVGLQLKGILIFITFHVSSVLLVGFA